MFFIYWFEFQNEGKLTELADLQNRSLGDKDSLTADLKAKIALTKSQLAPLITGPYHVSALVSCLNNLISIFFFLNWQASF